MVKYVLACDNDHRFESWFSNWDEYNAKAEAGDLECPECGSHAVKKTLSAPNIGVASAQPAPAPAPSCGAGGCASGMCPAMAGR